LIALVGLSAAAAVKENEEMFRSFLDYTSKFEKKYANIEEFVVRYQNYQASIARVAKLNAASTNAVYGVTKFSDMTSEEFKSTMLGYKPNPIAQSLLQMHTKHTHSHKKAHRVTANVTSWDWRDHGAVTAVKDQGQCGSCWAFSTAEEIESSWFMSKGQLPTLSEEQIVDCDTVDQGCNGGDTVTAYAYVKQAGGLVTEDSYPYTAGGGQSGTCSISGSFAASITGFEYATPPCTDACTNQDEATLASNLASQGPVSICVDAETWQDYSGGVITSNCDMAYTSLDHCVQLVGFDISDPSNSYWIVRNSWNTNWGEAGYLRVGYGSNLCGIADEATIAQV